MNKSSLRTPKRHYRLFLAFRVQFLFTSNFLVVEGYLHLTDLSLFSCIFEIIAGTQEDNEWILRLHEFTWGLASVFSNQLCWENIAILIYPHICPPNSSSLILPLLITLTGIKCLSPQRQMLESFLFQGKEIESDISWALKYHLVL